MKELIALFLHVGAQVSIPVRDVVAILDAGMAKQSREIPAFLSRAKSKGKVWSTPDREPRAIVVTSSGVYLSPVSASTLCRRLEALSPENLLQASLQEKAR